jgi:hypothetical protein
MDELQERLKRDAGRITADVTPEMQERLRASLESVRPERVVFDTGRIAGETLWLRSSLAGLVAAALIIVLVNWRRPLDEPREESDSTRPRTAISLQSGFPLKAETAEWATPLEQELENLQSDLEKARENVERDLRMSF